VSGTDQRVRLRIGRSAVRPRPGYRVWGPNAPCTRRSARGIRQQGSWWVYHWGRRWSTRRTMTAMASIVAEARGAWQRTCRPRMHQTSSSQKQPVDHPSYADHELDDSATTVTSGAQVTTSGTGRCAPAVSPPPHADHCKATHPIVIYLIHRFAASLTSAPRGRSRRTTRAYRHLVQVPPRT